MPQNNYTTIRLSWWKNFRCRTSIQLKSTTRTILTRTLQATAIYPSLCLNMLKTPLPSILQLNVTEKFTDRNCDYSYQR